MLKVKCLDFLSLQDAMSAFDFLGIGASVSPTSDRRREQQPSQESQSAPVPAPRTRRKVPEKPAQTSILELDQEGLV